MAELIHCLLGCRYTLREVSYLLHRLGWSSQAAAPCSARWRGRGV
ncbi:winged helix-turn-helix domain-containing protein [Streptomyces lavendulae]